MTTRIDVRGVRLHNLKNITLSIPRDQLVVLSGVSGSGKSSLGIDLLLKEGQRQYLEALGVIAFGMSKTPVDSITGLPPTISIDQHLVNLNPRSTVGTATDIYTYLRVLYARLGHRPCPVCSREIPASFDLSQEQWEMEYDHGLEDAKDKTTGIETFPCPHCGTSVPELTMAHFSFNKPEGACPTCTGLGSLHQVNLHRLVDEKKSIIEGAVNGWDANLINYHSKTLHAAANYYGFTFDLSLPLKDHSQVQRDLLFYGVDNPLFRRHFPEIRSPNTVRQGRFEGIATNLLRRYAERIEDVAYRHKLQEFLITQTCPDCEGVRLRPESRAVTINGQTITATSCLPLVELKAWLETLPEVFSKTEMVVAEPILEGLRERIVRVIEVGAGYLSLERASPSLSVGEAERLRLASLLGSSLSGVLYVFDEPTIGLHPRDTRRMIDLLRRLRDLGNTVMVIEHDLEMIAAADFLIDFGPGAGKHGGKVVAAGTPSEVALQSGSLTADYLAGRLSIPLPKQRRTAGSSTSCASLTISGARQHNLQNITVRLPLGLLVTVTGVSGSGKSTLIFNILERAARQHFYQAADPVGEHDSIQGWEHIRKVVTVNQEPIGRISRSNVATYADIFTPVRSTFAATAQAQGLSFSARHFSFNVPGGRCPRCEGAGLLTVKMQFLPDVEVRCPTCHGRRYRQEILEVKYHDHHIAQVLEMTVEEARELFKDVPAARSRLQMLMDVGLGYLQLGQPATKLSGGEAQRVKLAKELGRRPSGHTLYLLDEPTTGLHLHDMSNLLGVLQRLVDAGNSVITIEHNLEFIKTADWIIDLGPEGGAAGGRLIAQGTPEQIAQIPESYTGQYLQRVLHAPA